MKNLFFLLSLLLTQAVYAAAPTISCTPARTTGVAPLYVHMDCTGTIDTYTSHPMLDTYFEHTMGDVNAGTWLYGAGANTSKNYDTGAVAAHVYESAGTYTWNIRSCNIDGCSRTTKTIIVSNPDTVFSGTNTYCISSNTVPTAGIGGCPAGATTVQQSNFATITSTYALTGRRVLLKRGDTFTTSATASILQTGPGILGSYGTGSKPRINATASTSSILTFNVDTNSDYTWGDWRVMDLDFNGGGFLNAGGIGASGGFISILLLRDDFNDFRTSLGFGADALHFRNNHLTGVLTKDAWHHVMEQLGIFECTTNLNITGLPNTDYGGYIVSNKLAMLGNNISGSGSLLRYDENNVVSSEGNPNGSHLLRFPLITKAIIAHNHLLKGEGNRQLIKMHASYRCNAYRRVQSGNCTSLGLADSDLAWADDVGTNSSTSISGDGYAKFVRIADNYMWVDPAGSAQNLYFIVAGPQDTGEDERGHDIVIEQNIQLGHQYMYINNKLHWPYISVRNNIASVMSGYSYFTSVSREGGEPVMDHTYIYNNTFYKSTAPISDNSDGYTLVYYDNLYPTTVYVANNLGYAPQFNSAVLLNDIGPTTVTSSHTTSATGLTVQTNSSDTQVNSTDPLLSNIGGTHGYDYRPTVTGAYPANGGTGKFPDSYYDFYNCRDTTNAIRRGALVPKATARCKGSL